MSTEKLFAEWNAHIYTQTRKLLLLQITPSVFCEQIISTGEKAISDLCASINDFISSISQACSCFSATSYFTKFPENKYE